MREQIQRYKEEHRNREQIGWSWMSGIKNKFEWILNGFIEEWMIICWRSYCYCCLKVLYVFLLTICFNTSPVLARTTRTATATAFFPSSPLVASASASTTRSFVFFLVLPFSVWMSVELPGFCWQSLAKCPCCRHRKKVTALLLLSGTPYPLPVYATPSLSAGFEHVGTPRGCAHRRSKSCAG